MALLSFEDRNGRPRVFPSQRFVASLSALGIAISGAYIYGLSAHYGFSEPYNFEVFGVH